MKRLKIFAALPGLLFSGFQVFAQPPGPEAPQVNSFFERGPVKEYPLKTIYVGGEVANPGPVDLSALPLRSVAVKELAYEKGQAEFKGAYYFTGYSLYDILNSRLVKKVNADFSPEVDLYVVVENAKGEKAVFSWGEIYYSMQNFRALLTKSARPVNPAKMKTSWPLPAGPRLVCSGDLYNTRFIADPTKITVKSAEGNFPGEKRAAAFTPQFRVVYGGTTTVVSDTSTFPSRRYQETTYGHGMGYKGLRSAEGILLKDVLMNAGARPRNSGSALVIVSARDSYRAAFSLAEIINRNDNVDFLVTDKGLDNEDGRFALFSTTDFFVDRNVRSVDKIEILEI